jgi:N-acetylglucosamine kinase-like BadF-type ATPase
MAIYLGIDGGGTQTTCAVGDDHRVLASAVAGGSNMVRLGEHEARANLHEAIAKACAAARIAPDMVDTVVVGIAGASVPPVKESIAAMVRDLVPAEVEVVGDMVIAMEAAFAGLPGVVVISGTGSVAFGRNADGDSARAGGWGPAISDEGSGAWIGRSAVAALMRALDCADPTSLFRALLDAWRLDSIEGLLQKANATTAPDFARLFPAVESAACSGDELARQLLNQAGRELVRLAGVVIARLWDEPQPVRVAIGGGVFAHSAFVRRSFWAQLRAERPYAAVNFRIIQPIAGALWMARRLAAKIDGDR